MFGLLDNTRYVVYSSSAVTYTAPNSHGRSNQLWWRLPIGIITKLR